MRQVLARGDAEDCPKSQELLRFSEIAGGISARKGSSSYQVFADWKSALQLTFRTVSPALQISCAGFRLLSLWPDHRTS
jgi:hypothetical protein